MRILWFWPHPHRGESALAKAVLRSGDRLTVLCLGEYAGERLAGRADSYEIRRMLPDVSHAVHSRAGRAADRARVHVVRAWRRNRLASRGSYDLVHVEMVIPMVDAFALPLLKRKVPVVLQVHDVTPHAYRFAPAFERALLRSAYRGADRLLVFHETIRDRLVSELRVAADQIEVIPHPLPAAPTVTGGAPPLANRPPTVLFFGSFRPNKGLSDLIESIRLVGPGTAQFVVAGQGDADLEHLVRSAAREIPYLSAEVGFVGEERKNALYGRATVVVLPYTADFASQSGVLFDAYVRDLPVVVTDVGAIGPSVRQEGTGWVVPPGSPQLLAAALCSACSDEAAHGRMSARVMQARAQHEPGAVGRRYRAVYDEVTARRRS